MPRELEAWLFILYEQTPPVQLELINGDELGFALELSLDIPGLGRVEIRNGA